MLSSHVGISKSNGVSELARTLKKDIPPPVVASLSNPHGCIRTVLNAPCLKSLLFQQQPNTDSRMISNSFVPSIICLIRCHPRYSLYLLRPVHSMLAPISFHVIRRGDLDL